jgi:hypothetical protein
MAQALLLTIGQTSLSTFNFMYARMDAVEQERSCKFALASQLAVSVAPTGAHRNYTSLLHSGKMIRMQTWRTTSTGAVDSVVHIGDLRALLWSPAWIEYLREFGLRSKYAGIEDVMWVLGEYPLAFDSGFNEEGIRMLAATKHLSEAHRSFLTDEVVPALQRCKQQPNATQPSA